MNTWIINDAEKMECSKIKSTRKREEEKKAIIHDKEKSGRYRVRPRYPTWHGSIACMEEPH
jgi:hypothetical protein